MKPNRILILIFLKHHRISKNMKENVGFIYFHTLPYFITNGQATRLRAKATLNGYD